MPGETHEEFVDTYMELSEEAGDREITQSASDTPDTVKGADGRPDGMGSETTDSADGDTAADDAAKDDAADAAEAQLDDRSVAEDPLNWVPGEFVDEIDGSMAINRKGFEVLSHFYDVDVHTELQVPPEETGHECCRVKATAETADGRECEAFGSAHVDRDDDKVLLLELADTRARKRCLSIATGVGAVAVAELKSSVKEDV